MHIEREKLPKGMSYPLKSSLLEESLRQAGIETATGLRIGPGHGFFSASFWPPNANVGHERFHVTSGAVSTEIAYRARQQMNSEVIPGFIAWAKALLALPLNSPKRREPSHYWADYRAEG